MHLARSWQLEGSGYQFSRTFKILIADDCEDARNLLQLAMSEPGLETTICSDGEQALQSLKVELPDLAILDWQMPGATGIEVCQWLKQSSGRVFIPVILLTSLGALDDKVHGLTCGADEYMTKPFQFPELLARVRAMLRIKELADSLRETQDLLKEKEKLLVASQVGGAAAHELGQPLTALLLNCQLLSKIVDIEKPQVREMLQSVQQQCDTMRKILGQLNSITNFKTTGYVEDLQILDLGSGKSSVT